MIEEAVAVPGGAALLVLLAVVVWQALRIRTLQRRCARLTDKLTGLWEYGQWQSFAEDQSRDRQPSELIGVVFFDLDHFKELNDTYGHLHANDVLAEVGRRLATASRHWRFGRFGGDEIVGLIREVEGESHLDEVCRQIEQIVSEPVSTGGRLIAPSVTVGRVLSRDRSDRLSLLLAHADADLRRRKNSRPAPGAPEGIGRVEVAAMARCAD